MKKYHQKKIAMINDLSGYGRCSLTVAIPILSALKVQCCPVPTSIFSNHTGFPVYFFDDYTDKMPAYLEKWQELGLDFDGIATGFLGSEKQIAIVKDMIEHFRTAETKIIVDPIMGDHGKAYVTYTEPMCTRMRELVSMGNVVTPNVTEACILTGRTYRHSGWTIKELTAMAQDLLDMGPESVVITGISQGSFLANLALEKNGGAKVIRTRKIAGERPGTGDVFSSILAAGAVHGWGLEKSVRMASGFVRDCMKKSEELEIPVENGVCFEELLGKLTAIS